MPAVNAHSIPIQRAHGAGRVETRREGLVALHQAGSARIRFSRTDDGVREAVLINTAGGLTGGDRFSWTLALQSGATLRAVTQACEKIYRSPGPPAEIDVAMTLDPGAVLEWLPQETILFEGARLHRRFEIDLDPGAHLLAAEAVILGRRAMGEDDVDVSLHDRWRVRRDGHLIFSDDVRLSGRNDGRDGAALLAGARAFASVLMVAENAEARAAMVRPLLGDAGGVSAFDGKLFCRLLDADGAGLRGRLTAVIGHLRDGRAIPRLWTV
jgi:urease accessory protein